MKVETVYYGKDAAVLVTIPIGNLTDYQQKEHVNSVLKAVKKTFKGSQVTHVTTRELAENVPPSIILAAKDTYGEDLGLGTTFTVGAEA